MTEKYSDLRSLAEAATPGPWRVEHGSGGEINIIAPRKGFRRNGRENEWAIAKVGDEGLWDEDGPEFTVEDRANAAFIAETNPIAILALLDERASLLKALEGAREQFNEIQMLVRRIVAADENSGFTASTIDLSCDTAILVLDAAISPLQKEQK